MVPKEPRSPFWREELWRCVAESSRASTGELSSGELSTRALPQPPRQVEPNLGTGGVSSDQEGNGCPSQPPLQHFWERFLLLQCQQSPALGASPLLIPPDPPHLEQLINALEPINICALTFWRCLSVFEGVRKRKLQH